MSVLETVADAARSASDGQIRVVCGPAGGGEAFARALLRRLGVSEPDVAFGSREADHVPLRHAWDGGEIVDAIPPRSLHSIHHPRSPASEPAELSILLVRDGAAVHGAHLPTVDVTMPNGAGGGVLAELLREHLPMPPEVVLALDRQLGPACRLVSELEALERDWSSATEADALLACRGLPTMATLRRDVFERGGQRLMDLGRVLCLLRPQEVELGDEWAHTASALAGRAYSVSDISAVLHDFAGLFAFRQTPEMTLVRPSSRLAATLMVGDVPTSASEHFQLFQTLRGRAQAALSRSDVADAFVAEQLPRQAIAASAIDELAEDPIGILCSDSKTLVEEFEADPDRALLPGAKAALLCSHRLLAHADRASQLVLSARRVGLDSFANELDESLPHRRWRPLWARAAPSHTHRLLLNHRSAVLAVSALGPPLSGAVFAGCSDGSLWRLHVNDEAVRLDDGNEFDAEIRALDAQVVEGRVIVAVATSDHAVAVLDGTTGELLWRDGEAHSNPLSAVVVAGADRAGQAVVLSAGVDGVIVGHAALTGVREAAPLHVHGSEIRGLCGVSPGGAACVLFCAVDGAVALLDLGSKTLRREWHTGGQILNSIRGRVRGDELLVIAGTQAGAVLRGRSSWDDGAEAHGPLALDELMSHSAAVNAVALGAEPEEPSVFSGSNDRTWRWQPPDGPAVGPVIGHVGPICALDEVEHLERRYVVTGGGDGSCRVWLQQAMIRERLPITQPTHYGATSSIRLAAAGEDDFAVLTGGVNGAVHMGWTARPSASLLLTKHDDEVTAMTLEDGFGSGGAVFSGARDGTLRRTTVGPDGVTSSEILGIVHEGITTLCNATSPGGRPTLISGGLDGTIANWDMETGVVRAMMSGCEYGAVSALCQTSARAVVVGGQDGTLTLRREASLERRRWSRLDASILALAPLPEHDGDAFVAGLSDGQIAFVDELGPQRERIRLVQASPGEITAVVCVVLDSKVAVAVAGLDRTLRLFDTASGGLLAEIDLDGYALSLDASLSALALATSAGATVMKFPTDPLLLGMRTDKPW